MYSMYIFLTEIDLNAVCGESTDICADSLAECQNDTEYKCLCKDNNFENKTGLCSPRKILYIIALVIQRKTNYNTPNSVFHKGEMTWAGESYQKNKLYILVGLTDNC